MPLPNPNGYDDFVEAGSLRLGYPPDWKAASIDELRQSVDRNRPVFDLVRTGLSRECRVDPNKSTNYLVGTTFTVIAQKFLVEGELAMREERRGDAVRTYLDLVRFGHESSRGGELIDRLRGLAYERMGLGPIKVLLVKLDVRQCREAVRTLQNVEDRAESLPDIRSRDRRCARQKYGIQELIYRLRNFRQVKQAEQKTATKFNDIQNERRQLIVDLAARAYELETGKRPVSVAELVPTYLKAVPVNAHSGTAIGITEVR